MLLVGFAFLLMPTVVVGGFAHVTRHQRTRRQALMRLCLLDAGAAMILALGSIGTRGTPTGCAPNSCMFVRRGYSRWRRRSYLIAYATETAFTLVEGCFPDDPGPRTGTTMTALPPMAWSRR